MMSRHLRNGSWRSEYCECPTCGFAHHRPSLVLPYHWKGSEVVGPIKYHEREPYELLKWDDPRVLEARDAIRELTSRDGPMRDGGEP